MENMGDSLCTDVGIAEEVPKAEGSGEEEAPSAAASIRQKLGSQFDLFETQRGKNSPSFPLKKHKFWLLDCILCPFSNTEFYPKTRKWV